MLHKWEAIMGLPEDSLAYQMEEHYHGGKWAPNTGETALSKRTDSNDYVYDPPERLKQKSSTELPRRSVKES